MTIAEQATTRELTDHQAEWRYKLQEAHDFFSEHPDLISDMRVRIVAVAVSGTPEESPRLRRFLAAAGRGLKVTDSSPTHTYVDLLATRFHPHDVGMIVRRQDIGEPVEVPGTITEWKYLGGIEVAK